MDGKWHVNRNAGQLGGGGVGGGVGHDRSCDGLPNDLSSIAALNNFLLTDGRPTSLIASACSAPDTLDMYHDCSKESNTGIQTLWPISKLGGEKSARIDILPFTVPSGAPAIWRAPFQFPGPQFEF